MHVVIIGAGIAGPVMAVALQKAGIESTVYEAHQQSAENRGLFLALGVNGMRALDELELLAPVLRAPTIPTPRLEFQNASGRSLGTVSNGWLRAGTPSVTISRGALQGALAAAARRAGVPFRYGKRLVDYQSAGDSVTVHFADGGEVRTDLLVGADGIHSRVRQLMSPEAPAPSYTGLLNFGGIVGNSGLAPTPDTMRMIWGQRAFFGYTVRPSGEAWWFANIGRQHEPARGVMAEMPAEDWRGTLVELFADDPSFIADLIERTPGIWGTPIHDLPSVPAWQRGRVALIGDAAHAVSPSAGQGASLAIEDALMLARCLRDVTPVRRALEHYEALRRPRAERIVALGRQRGNYKAPSNRASLWLRDLLMPLALRMFATEQRTAWIHDYRIDWDQPVTRGAA